jgi:hypothetical protein
MLEPDEPAEVAPVWRNNNLGGTLCGPITLAGHLDLFTGPYPEVYTILDATALYPDIPPQAQRSCTECYSVQVSAPGGRPALHWDTIMKETVDNPSGGEPFSAYGPAVSGYPPGVTTEWTLHVGESFSDVPRSHSFYRPIETLLHAGLTSGCGAGAFCPDAGISRAEMAVFLLKARHGPSYSPPPCTGLFDDVPCPGGFAVKWIEQLSREEITAGCDAHVFCPDGLVTRGQMAVLLLKAADGGDYEPPPCTGVFEDVPCPGLFTDWIEELRDRQVTAGCAFLPPRYCPEASNTRAQMATFLVRTFELNLY